MAVNEETEWRALEGELYLLEEEWREAEELASISDDLLVPGWVREWIHDQKTRRGMIRKSGAPSNEKA